MLKDLMIPKSRIALLCQRYHIRKMSLFGSVLGDDFGPDSDVDVLVEFEPGWTPGLGIVDLGEEISHLFENRRADIVNPKYLNGRLRDRVLASAEAIYEKG